MPYGVKLKSYCIGSDQDKHPIYTLSCRTKTCKDLCAQTLLDIADTDRPAGLTIFHCATSTRYNVNGAEMQTSEARV